MMIRVGITGLRDLRNYDIAALADDIRRELAALASGHRRRVLLSSLAAGADQLCAEIGISLGYDLVCPLPFAQARDDFSGEALGKFDALIGKASRTIIISNNQDLDLAYLEAGKYVADHCDVLLAVWDGIPQSSICGTQAVMEYAEKINREIIHIQPRNGRT